MAFNFLITGDCHGQFGRFKNLEQDPNTAIIILGDAGLNYNLNENDTNTKRGLCKKYPFTFYGLELFSVLGCYDCYYEIWHMSPKHMRGHT